MKYVIVRTPFLLLLAAMLACGPSVTGEGDDDDDGGGLDGDGDGWTEAEGDCNDANADVNPGAPDDTCDNVDNDCNGKIDDPFDTDGDNWSTCAGDCNDDDPSIWPGAPEIENGLDDDCDGTPDNNLPNVDDDGDGWTDNEGDCDDDEPLVNPGAVEVPTADDGNGNQVPEGVDNDCDGMIDEPFTPCDTGLDPANVDHYPQAIELCEWVTSATFTASADTRARNIVPGFGSVYTPHAGGSMAVLSSGLAVDPSDASWVAPVIGTEFTNTASHPDPQPDPADGCGMADPASVNDYLELTLTISVPTNAKSLIYDFNFMSGEFPTWVCSEYDDTFVALLESTSFNGNISFDDAGRPVTINIGFFDVCEAGLGPDCTGASELAGTGYETYGGTGWLTTYAPVTPGEEITLRFIIFDEGDHIWDSLVLIDNFRWDAEPVDGPITIPRDHGAGLPRGPELPRLP